MMESRSISDVLQHQGTHEAYDYFATALKNKTLDSVFCQLGMLACRLQTSTISLIEAQKQFEKLKNSANDLNIQELNTLFNILSNEKKYAAYFYNFAHIVDELTHVVDETSKESLSQAQLKITKQMLDWEDENSEYILKQINLALEMIDTAKKIFADVKYQTLDDKQSIENLAGIQSSLLETLGDALVDESEKLKNNEKIALLLEAAKSYQLALKLYSEKKLPLAEFADETIGLDLSILFCWEEIAKADKAKSSHYVNLIKNYIFNTDFEKKIAALDKEIKISADDKIASHLKDCDAISKEFLEKNGKRVLDSQIPQSIKRKKIGKQEEVVEIDLDQSNTDNMELVAALPSIEAAMPTSDQSERFSIYRNPSILFSSGKYQLQLDSSNDEEIKNHVLDAIKTFLARALNNAQHPKSILGALLGQIARFHARSLNRDDSNIQFKAEMTQALFEKSLIITVNKKIELEVANFRNQYHSFLKGDHRIENCNGRLNRYKNAFQEFKQPTLNENAQKFFDDSITKYIERIQKNLSQESVKIFGDLLKYLANRDFILEFQHFNTTIKSYGLVKLGEVFLKNSEALSDISHSTYKTKTL